MALLGWIFGKEVEEMRAARDRALASNERLFNENFRLDERLGQVINDRTILEQKVHNLQERCRETSETASYAQYFSTRCGNWRDRYDAAEAKNVELLEANVSLTKQREALRDELSVTKLSRDKWQEMADVLRKRLDAVGLELEAEKREKDSWEEFASKLENEADDLAARNGLTP